MTYKGTYEYFTQYNANAYTKGRPNYGTPKEIVIHHWGRDGQKFTDVINYFCRTDVGESAHYVVEANKVACLVDCENTAYHAGNWDENCKSIGIECRPECTNADIITVAQLVAELWQAYPNMSRKLRFHKEFYNTACPGRWQYQLAKIERLANEFLSGKKPAPKPVNNEIWHTVKPNENLSTICLKYGVTNWQAVARMNKLANPNLIYPGQKLRIK